MNKSNKKMYLDIHYLRGLAILFIVWGHLRASLYLQGKVSFDETWVIFEHYRAIIVDGGTSLFVFISGFLFSKIYVEKNINYFDFLSRKRKQYCCLSSSLQRLLFCTAYLGNQTGASPTKVST